LVFGDKELLTGRRGLLRGEGRQVLILDSGKGVLFSDSGCGRATPARSPTRREILFLDAGEEFCLYVNVYVDFMHGMSVDA